MRSCEQRKHSLTVPCRIEWECRSVFNFEKIRRIQWKSELSVNEIVLPQKLTFRRWQ